MSTPDPVFSVTARIVLLPSVNTGARFSVTSMTLIVTVMVASSVLSAGGDSYCITGFGLIIKSGMCSQLSCSAVNRKSCSVCTTESIGESVVIGVCCGYGRNRCQRQILYSLLRRAWCCLPSVNTGALLAETPLTSVTWIGDSSTSVMFIVTSMIVVILPSKTATDTV